MPGVQDDQGNGLAAQTRLRIAGRTVLSLLIFGFCLWVGTSLAHITVLLSASAHPYHPLQALVVIGIAILDVRALPLVALLVVLLVLLLRRNAHRFTLGIAVVAVQLVLVFVAEGAWVTHSTQDWMVLCRTLVLIAGFTGLVYGLRRLHG